MDTKAFGLMAADLLEKNIGKSQGMSFPTEMPPQQPLPPQFQQGVPETPMEPMVSTLAQPPVPEAPTPPEFYEPPPMDYTQPEQPPAFMTLDDSMPPPPGMPMDNQTSSKGPLRRDAVFNPNINPY
jgi:hypothetical protein